MRYFSQTFLALLVDEHEDKLGGKVIYEALGAGNYLDLARSHARWARPPLHPGRFLELICVTRIDDPKATTRTREPQIAPQHEVLSGYVLGVTPGYRLVQVVI